MDAYIVEWLNLLTRWLHFVVADNGRGMSEAQRRRLFSAATSGQPDPQVGYGGSALLRRVERR